MKTVFFNYSYCRDIQVNNIKNSRKLKKVLKQKTTYIYKVEYDKTLFRIFDSISLLKGVKFVKVDERYVKLRIKTKLLRHPFLWRSLSLILRTRKNNFSRLENCIKIFNYMYDYVENKTIEECINNWKKYEYYESRISENIKSGNLIIDEEHQLKLYNIKTDYL